MSEIGALSLPRHGWFTGRMPPTWEKLPEKRSPWFGFEHRDPPTQTMAKLRGREFAPPLDG